MRRLRFCCLILCIFFCCCCWWFHNFEWCHFIKMKQVSALLRTVYFNLFCFSTLLFKLFMADMAIFVNPVDMKWHSTVFRMNVKYQQYRPFFSLLLVTFFMLVFFSLEKRQSFVASERSSKTKKKIHAHSLCYNDNWLILHWTQ